MLDQVIITKKQEENKVFILTLVEIEEKFYGKTDLQLLTSGVTRECLCNKSLFKF